MLCIAIVFVAIEKFENLRTVIYQILKNDLDIKDENYSKVVQLALRVEIWMIIVKKFDQGGKAAIEVFQETCTSC